jgi:hypothetical protein
LLGPALVTYSYVAATAPIRFTETAVNNVAVPTTALGVKNNHMVWVVRMGKAVQARPPMPKPAIFFPGQGTKRHRPPEAATFVVKKRVIINRLLAEKAPKAQNRMEA